MLGKVTYALPDARNLMRALRLADHVTKRIGVSGDENVMDEKRENMMQDHNLLMRKVVLRRGCIFSDKLAYTSRLNILYLRKSPDRLCY